MQSFVILFLFALGGASALTAPAPVFFNTTGNATDGIIVTSSIPLHHTAINGSFIHSQTWFDGWTPSRPWAPQLSIVDFFIKVVRGEMFGSRRCKKDHECGVGLKCNALLHWCAPWDAPNDWQEFGNNCTSNAECSDLYYCLMGRCRFTGPRPCRSSFECAAGMANVSYDCVDTEDLEKHSVVQQLGRETPEADLKPHKKHHDHKVEIESEEVAQFGPTAEGDHLTHGKRCWAQCNFDTDCGFLRFPALLLKDNNISCCNGYCTRKQSCVSVPAVFRPTTAAPLVFAAIPV